jgi:hypothetical protein
MERPLSAHLVKYWPGNRAVTEFGDFTAFTRNGTFTPKSVQSPSGKGLLIGSNHHAGFDTHGRAAVARLFPVHMATARA